ncbi:MAG: 4-phosphoerythronate dehydrogenase PdxB [Marinobacterium sp.]|nr:4-phosphoerythronate dehydrogenase PdxB [Marinobacterium sp.]
MSDCELLIVADENMPAVEALFGHLGRVERVAGRSLHADQVRDADLLLVRSVSRVDAQLLENSRVKFVGTATIGTDHVDTGLLAQRGIGFSAAPGCNADAVVDYVLCSLVQQAARLGFRLQDKKVGIIGVGNVGGRLARRLTALGVELLLNDPPRAEHEAGFVALDKLLADADIVCMHTPLTRTGNYPTHHLLSSAQLALLKSDVILLNAGRGPAIDNQALLELMPLRPDMTLILDVWEHEPRVDPQLAAFCEIATPHIAGYSLDGKIRGSWMLYKAWCEYSQAGSVPPLTEFLPASSVRQLSVTSDAELLELMRLCYDPYRDDRALRRTLHLAPGAQQQAFDQLRRQYPVRRELMTLNVHTDDAIQQAVLCAAGFSA